MFCCSSKDTELDGSEFDKLVLLAETGVINQNIMKTPAVPQDLQSSTIFCGQRNLLALGYLYGHVKRKPNREEDNMRNWLRMKRLATMVCGDATATNFCGFPTVQLL